MTAWCKPTFSFPHPYSIVLIPIHSCLWAALKDCAEVFLSYCTFLPLCHPNRDGNHSRAEPVCYTRASGVSSGTAQKHSSKTYSEQYQKLQRAPYGKYGATAHSCACLFQSFVRHAGGARLGQPLFVKAKRLPLLPLPVHEAPGLCSGGLSAPQTQGAITQISWIAAHRMLFAALGINSFGIEEMLRSSRNSSTRPPGRTAGTTEHRGAAALGWQSPEPLQSTQHRLKLSLQPPQTGLQDAAGHLLWYPWMLSFYIPKAAKRGHLTRRPGSSSPAFLSGQENLEQRTLREGT